MGKRSAAGQYRPNSARALATMCPGENWVVLVNGTSVGNKWISLLAVNYCDSIAGTGDSFSSWFDAQATFNIWASVLASIRNPLSAKRNKISRQTESGRPPCTARPLVNVVRRATTAAHLQYSCRVTCRHALCTRLQALVARLYKVQ